MAINYFRIVDTYISEIESGKQIAGELEKLAVARHLNDLDFSFEKKIYFDKKAATKAFAFFNLLKHSKGEFYNKQFVLSPWQAFIVYNLFGWMRADGTRRFRYAYIEVARKNGKTTFAAAIALMMMVFDGERGAEIYFAATKEKQAKICWDEAKAMVATSGLKKYITVYRSANTMVMDSTMSKMEPLSRDSDKLDGLNIFCAICDEKHAWRTNDLYGVITTATGARRQPMVITITTAGHNKTYPCFAERRINIEILKGHKQQDNTFVIIFTIDEDDDISDPKIWKKSNPNLGISVNPDYLAEEYDKAMNHGGSTMFEFKTKLLNIWVDAPIVWIPDTKIDVCTHGITDEDLLGRDCYSGLDLAANKDLNALVHFFPDVKGVAVVKVEYWIPEAKVEDKEDIVDYRDWVSRGLINTTSGDIVDVDTLVAGIAESVKRYNCLSLGYDPYLAHGGVVQGLDKEGLKMLVQVPQRVATMSEPMKELERMVYLGSIELMNNPVLKWNFRNMVAKIDDKGNIMPDKKKSQNRIDGVVATIIAIAAFNENKNKKTLKGWAPRNLPQI